MGYAIRKLQDRRAALIAGGFSAAYLFAGCVFAVGVLVVVCPLCDLCLLTA